jgi:hypothetical protein
MHRQTTSLKEVSTMFTARTEELEALQKLCTGIINKNMWKWIERRHVYPHQTKSQSFA